MAGIALRTRRDMVGRFAQGIGAVVTGGADACCTRIVRIARLCPGNRRLVAGVALSRSTDVRGRFGLSILGDIGTAMASRTLPRKTAVIHDRRRPNRKAIGVAGVTLSTGWNVRQRFVLGVLCHISATVTGSALPGGTRVIHPARCPNGESAGVAGVTLISGRYMRCRLGQRIGE